MTTVEKAAMIIAGELSPAVAESEAMARRVIVALREKKIGLTAMAASADLFTRFHAHCRHLGIHSGDGYEHWYNEAIEHAMKLEDWPCKVITKTVDVDGQSITVDVRVPESTKRANNRQLLLAYEVIEWEAKQRGIVLPENVEEVG